MSEETFSRREKFLEYFTAILLGLTTTFGALAAYYNSLWSGSSNENFVKSTVTMGEANSGILASLNFSISNKLDQMKDDVYYTEWKRNLKEKDPDTSYFFAVMSPERQTDLIKGTADMESTEVFKKQLADSALNAQIIFSSDSAQKAAVKQMETAEKEGEYGDEFTLITVLYTVVLFFAGFASLKISNRLKLIYLACAVLIFAGTTVKFFMLPFPS